VAEGRRLLYVATVPAPLHNFLRPYAAHFRSKGWEVHAAAAGATKVESLAGAFESVHELTSSRSLRNPLRIYRGLADISALVRELQPDVVHVHTPIAGFVTRFALGRQPPAKRPAIVYTAHGFHAFDGGPVARNTAYSLMESVAGRWTDALIVINDEDEERALRWRMVAPGHLHHMPGIGVDTAYYHAPLVPEDRALEFRGTAGIDAAARLFVMIAELHAVKRPFDAIKALHQMQSSDAHLAFLGNGPLEPELKQLADSLGLADRVHFCGFVQDVRPALASATALLLTSEREGLPRAIMESLAMGVPVVTTAARGCAELVESAGAVVPVGDVLAIAASLEGMDRDSAEWKVMSAAGRARMVDRYDLSRLLALHERLYLALVANKSSPTPGGSLASPPVSPHSWSRPSD
jgi:glycosyltransferase involved in cell wall biosynthesis